MAWPEATDYNEAIQNPAVCFLDPDLKQGRPEVNALGWPLPCAGNFAAVYKVFGPDGTPWAVKCFTRAVSGLRERYHALSAHLRRAKLPFTVDFAYLEQGIRIRGDWYAVVKMRWVEGLTLNDFLKGHLDKPQLLERLSALWVKLSRELRRAAIAHADLQHGNVLLVPGDKSGVLRVRLIDYDGMHVPALAGTPSGEVGHANFQHPERAQRRVYDAEVDRFPHLVIYTALRALLCGGRALWERHDNGENLLFRAQDFADPAQSALFRELWQLPDPAVRSLTTHLARACQGPIAEVPQLSDLVEAPASKEPTESPAQPQPARTVLGVLEAGVQKPPASVLMARKGAPAEPPPTVEPIGLRRREPVPPLPRRLDTRTLILIGGGVAALLLVAVIGLIVVVAGSGADPELKRVKGPLPPPVPVPPIKGEQLRKGEGPGGVEVGFPPQLRGIRVPDVTLHPGESKTVEVSVDRGDHKGRIELIISEMARGGIGPAPFPGPGRAGAATLEVDKSVVLLPGQVKAPLRVTAGAGMMEDVREFAVESGGDGPAEAGFGPGPGAPGPAGPGAKVGAGPVRAVFKVTVRRAPRSNPDVLPVGNVVDGRPAEMQVDVVRAGILSLDHNPATRTVAVQSQPGVGGDRPTPMPLLVPQRLVVVSATFPYRDQVEAIRKALRFATVEELFADPATAPRFLGLDVQRREVQPDGSRTPWAPLYRVGPDSDRVTVDPAVDKLLREAAYDAEQAERAAAASFPGLTTPLPALAAGKYPRLDLKGIDARGGEDEMGKRPVPVGGRPAEFGPKYEKLRVDGGAARLTRVRIDLLAQELQDRLAGKYFAFDPHGASPEEFRDPLRPLGPPKGFGPGNRPGGPGGRPGGPLGKLPPAGVMVPPGPGGERLPAKCLVRFFDAGVRPGKVYEYAIKVCMANPNRGKLDPVRAPQEADLKYLFSPPVVTPSVAIGPEYHVYAADQPRPTAKVKGLYSPNNRAVDTSPATANLAAVQVHRWLGEYADARGSARRLGDWLVAERLLVPRGESLARSQFLTPVPEWNQAKGQFEFASAIPGQTRPPPKAGPHPAIVLDLDPERTAPLLVDFRGGRRDDYLLPSGLVRDDGAAELLVLSPDGTLDVRSSREDADPETRRGRERLQRQEAWRQRLQEIHDAALGNAGLNPFVPKN